MAQRQNLADFGLQRGTGQNYMTPSFAFLEGKANPVNMARNGQKFFTERAGDESRAFSDFAFTYVHNVAERTLVVFAAFLVNEVTEQRYTDMRAWQMIVDAWLTGGGNQPAGTPEGLRYLAFHDIIESTSKETMVTEMNQQWTHGQAIRTFPSTEVVFTSASANWSSNPWIRCSENVARALSTSTQTVTASRAWSVLTDQDEYNLIVELTSTPVTAADGAQSAQA